MERINWTREETIVAFDLYCRMVYGRIHARNPEIISVANLLGRSPAAVVRKIGNLAHYDPVQQSRGVNGLPNGSHLDYEIFNEFYQNLEELAYQAKCVLAEKQGIGVEKLLDDDDLEEVSDIPEGENREGLVKKRIGQKAFRDAVLSSYNNKCCITGLEYPSLLIASHIKPWSDCNNGKERTDPSNGLCLNSFHDKAFDIGLITVTAKDYKIIVSDRLKFSNMDESIRSWILKYDKQIITMPTKFPPRREYLEYHNDVVFHKQ